MHTHTHTRIYTNIKTILFYKFINIQLDLGYVEAQNGTVGRQSRIDRAHLLLKRCDFLLYIRAVEFELVTRGKKRRSVLVEQYARIAVCAKLSYLVLNKTKISR